MAQRQQFLARLSRTLAAAEAVAMLVAAAVLAVAVLEVMGLIPTLNPQVPLTQAVAVAALEVDLSLLVPRVPQAAPA
jgi:hypothetical protein